MKRVYGGRFYDVNVSAIRSALRELAAELVLPRTLHKRATFANEPVRADGFSLRLYTTESHAILTIPRAEDDAPSRELETAVSDFDACRELLEAIGLTTVSYQENYREEWELDSVTCNIDEWPGLPPFVDIAGPDPDAVFDAAARLGLDSAVASSGRVEELYKEPLERDILAERFLALGEDDSA